MRRFMGGCHTQHGLIVLIDSTSASIMKPLPNKKLRKIRYILDHFLLTFYARILGDGLYTTDSCISYYHTRLLHFTL